MHPHLLYQLVAARNDEIRQAAARVSAREPRASSTTPPKKRIRVLGRGNGWRRLRPQTSAMMNSNPLTLPRDLDHQELAG
jgi:hypothetical protein